MNNKRVLSVFLWAFLLLSCGLKAQVAVERSSEIVKIGGKEYYMHHVKAGQTLFGIAQAYEVTVEEIERLNPEVKDGLKADGVIGIPVVSEAGNEVFEAVEQVPENIENKPVGLQVGKEYVVQSGENLYAIAKKFGIDVAEFKAINPGLTNEPKAGTVIQVPNIVNEDDYIVHKVEFNERTSSLLKRWKVSESEFREKNISVGSHVFVNQVVLIPIDRVMVVQEAGETLVAIDDEELQPTDTLQNEITILDEETFEMPECDPTEGNGSRHYKVVLLIPLYLQDIGSLELSKENVSRAQKSRSLSFLQYYEGFMMAVENMTKNHGLKLDLTVIDVTENVSTAESALSQIEGKGIDLIVGPFFRKSFDVVEAYAKEHDILVVNPLSMRESVIEGNPNVVKVKPGKSGKILGISSLVKNYYRDANVFIVSKEDTADTAFLNSLEFHLNRSVNEEVAIPTEEFLNYARSESQRLEMGDKMVTTVDVEGQVYSTNDLESSEGDVVLHNFVKRYSYSSELGTMKSQLSGVRNNLVIAYGDNNVFATQILNSLKKSADRKPITLVAISDWSKFEKLLVDNLLDMNAIYFSDCFVDYSDEEVKRFVSKFRAKYKAEPQNYAFEGYDVAWYFLNALMRYGSDMRDCLPYYTIPLMHTQFHFMGKGKNSGLENQSWSIYQYDKESIELHPLNPFKTTGNE